MVWAIWAALIVAVLTVLAALVFLAVRLLQGWRAFKRFRRHLGKELDKLADAVERTTAAAERASDTRRLDESLGHLRATLAALAIVRDAYDEATGGLRRLYSLK
jgi:hypothetical protein